DAAHRGQGAQQLRVAFRVAVLVGGGLGDPGFGAGEEGREVGHAAHGDPGAEDFGVPHQGGHHQVAAVGAAHDGQPPRVGQALDDGVGRAVGDVVDRVEAAGAQVGVDEGPAVTRGAADVGGEDVEAPPEEFEVERVQDRAFLFLGPAVQVHDAGG